MEQYNKLVRDKIPEILDAKGVRYEKWVAEEDEYRQELIRKLEEETDEFAQNPTIEELADVMEVVAALQALPEYAHAEEVRKHKRAERGGFEKRIILKGEKA